MNVLDFNSLEPHAPTGEQLLDFFLDSTSQLLSIAQDVLDAKVGNLVSQN